MSRKGTSAVDKASSRARTLPSQIASPGREGLQALVQRISKLHYGCFDDAAVQYLQGMASKLHNHSRVVLRISTVECWKESLQCGTLLYGIESLAPTLSTQVTKLLAHLDVSSSTDPTSALEGKSIVSEAAKSLIRRIAVVLAANSLVRDLLPLVTTWTCFDASATGAGNGQTVYLNTLLSAIAKHKPLLDKFGKLGPFVKVKAAFSNASKAVSNTKGGLAHDKNRKALARLQTELQKAIDVYQGHYLKYLYKVKDSRGRRPYLDLVPEDISREADSSSIASAHSEAGSRIPWPVPPRTYRRPLRRGGSATSSESASSIDIIRRTPSSRLSASSNASSDPDGQRAAFFRTSEAHRTFPHIFPPPMLPPPPLPRWAESAPRPPPSRPPIDETASIENWRQTVAQNIPPPLPPPVPSTPAPNRSLPPLPPMPEPLPGQDLPEFGPQPAPPPPPPPLRPPMILPPPYHPPMVYPPRPPTPINGNLPFPPSPPIPPSLSPDSHTSSNSGSNLPLPPPPHPPIPRPPSSGGRRLSMSGAPIPRPSSSDGRRSSRSGSDSSGGHWDPTMRTWPPPLPPPPPEPKIRWPELPQALTDAYNELQVKDSAFRKAQAAYFGIVLKRDTMLGKAHAFDELPRACCDLLLFLHNNFDLHTSAKKLRPATKPVLR